MWWGIAPRLRVISSPSLIAQGQSRLLDALPAGPITQSSSHYCCRAQTCIAPMLCSASSRTACPPVQMAPSAPGDIIVSTRHSETRREGSSQSTRVLAYRLTVANGLPVQRGLEVGCLFTRPEVGQLYHVPSAPSCMPKVCIPNTSLAQYDLQSVMMRFSKMPLLFSGVGYGNPVTWELFTSYLLRSSLHV